MDFFKDKDKKIVLAQAPNPPFLGWIVVSILAKVVHSPSAVSGLTKLATASLFVWAYLELTDGDSRFRKLLGLATIVYIAWGFFR